MYSYKDRIDMIELMKVNNILLCFGVICGMGEFN